MTIELCGHLSVSVDGRRREADLPGRQGRLALAHLALNRKGGVTRERLIAALWGEDAPAGHAQALNVVLSKLRRALGPEVIENAGERAVQLTPSATVDFDAVQPALDEAFAARDRGDWPAVVEAARRVAELAEADLLPGYEAPWLEDPRRRLEELGLQARELRGDAGLAMGGAELAAAERAAQELVELAPYRESGYLLLMRVREAQGNLAEALRVHERLRTLLRDELGVAPGPQVQAEFDRMLKAERAEAEPEPARPAPAPAPVPAAADGQAFFATRSGAAFVGRVGELDRLSQYLERATEGNRQLVLLEGEPGIGKTRLAMQFMDACEAEGSLALYGRCDAETLVPYQPFVEALRRYVARAPEQAGAWRTQYGAELGRVIPELAGAGDTPGGPEEEERYRLFDAVSEVLNDIARHQPVVLVLDDLHWADKPTLLMLRQMVRAAGESPLLIVATIRDTERPTALVDMLVQLRREHYFDRIELTGLDEEDATALIGEFGPQDIPDHVNRALWEETKGNPFFLEEMVRHLGTTSPNPEGNGSAWPLELPEGIREVIGRRLATLSERAGQLLTTAAVMGREFRVEVLEQVSDLDEDELDEVIEESVGAHVIAEVPGVYGRCSFTHALIRQTLYDGLTATRRARLHLRVAEALEQLDADAAELAYHFSLAPPQRGAPKAVEYAETAARRATGVLAYEEAARLYAVALAALEQAPDGAEHRCRLLLALGHAQTKAGDTIEAHATFRAAADTARALGSAPLLAQAALGYGAPGQMAGGIVDDELVALLEEALDAVGDSDPALRSRLVGRLAIELSFSEARERRAELSSEAVELARQVGDPRGLGFALVARHWSLWGPGNVQERLEAANDLLGLAESSGDERLAIAGHRWRMIDLLELGDIDAVDIEIDAYARIAEQRRRLSDSLYVHIYRAMRLLLAGEFDAAEAEGYAAVSLGNRVQDPNTGNATLLQACTLRRERGRLERLEAPVRAYAERFHAIPGWVCVLAHLLAETGRTDEAREILDNFAADDFRGLPLDGIWLGAVGYLAETAAALGDATHAQALHDLLEPYADRNVAIGWASACTGSAARHLGLLADLLGKRKQAIAYFETALAMNERMRARPWVAHSQVELARVLSQQAAGRERAGELLDLAAAEAEQLGMPRLVERAEAVRSGAAVTP